MKSKFHIVVQDSDMDTISVWVPCELNCLTRIIHMIWKSALSTHALHIGTAEIKNKVLSSSYGHFGMLYACMTCGFPEANMKN